ncbi:nucleotidyltransferase AbiEii toxin of type IV toxin-antitoxin system [Tamilnaduibacter salinus]|uniref:Nucleotidyltransferase AbiEii toxin of type IV toxin-antitoxin system n=1 Tax=Tamilnaduibacter salinus TaxID=1484056 RepID=A0A2U1CX92_9GAMM|nr:nucleotidyl transferase AbiEii/AbiGii toxin family protein [Tamilnaduibacter salinus]PVY76862.1 nucleotidyltransferase AbiEii toxin of type IV toxin-antitoxin system [Tamilnaduibacter salinus]
MSTFDALVNQALKNQRGLAALRPVVEKEIFHHDIIRELNQADLLQHLTFIDGTCLRACYGSTRLSEDLDFTGGANFEKSDLDALKNVLESRLREKYQTPISVTDPKAERQGNVDTWKLRINTQPERPDMPAQRIHLDICAVPSYQVEPRTLQNHYRINLGTDNMIINVQSQEEIFADKLIAFGMRPGRLKHRDLWDIAWLTQRGVRPAYDLLDNILTDHGESPSEFLTNSESRLRQLSDDPQIKKDFAFEMQRFIAPDALERTVHQSGFWTYSVNTVSDAIRQAQSRIDGSGEPDQPDFPM